MPDTKAAYEARKEKALQMWVNNPNVPLDDIAKMAGIGSTTFWKYRQMPDFMERYHILCKERFAALEAKAVAALEKQIDEGSFQATKYALDAAGYAAAKKIDIDATTTYTIVVDE